MELKPCPECGVPEFMTSEHLWLNNGDIVQKRHQIQRLVFIETENIDPLLRGIEQIIGMDIEPIVITAVRRAVRSYMKAYVPEAVSEKIRNKEFDYERQDATFRDVARLNGLGNFNLVDRRYERDEHDYDTISVSEPHSVPMAVAAHVGAIESLIEVDLDYSYQEVSPNEYKITAFPSPHPEELHKKMWFEPYHHLDGDLELEKCSTCGGPKALSAYCWYPDRGVITSTATGRRMSILGPAELDPIFHELEAEFGDAVPRVVVEAQRRFTRSGFYTLDDITDKGDFRTQLALRGLGNLKEWEMNRAGMRMRLENAVLPFMTVGQAHGFFDMGYSMDSSVDWELSDEGDLQVEIKPMVSR